jgi:hypothetical protein
MGQLRYVRYRTRILSSVQNTAFGQSMIECDSGKGKPCGSVYCEKCRSRKQERLFYRYRKHYEKALAGDEEVARGRLRWVTVLHSVVPVNENNFAKTISDVVIACEEMKGKLSNLARCETRNHKSGLWLRGGIHLEIVDYRAFSEAAGLGKGTEKQRTLSMLIQRLGAEKSDFYILVHFHALADMGSLQEKDFNDLFAKRWSSASRQVDIQQLWDVVRDYQRDSEGKVVRDGDGKRVLNSEKKMEIEHSLRAFARYCYDFSNHRLEYAINWSHGRYVTKTGEELSAKGLLKVAELGGERGYSKRLTPEHIQLLVEVSNAVNGPSHKGLEVRIY